MANLARLIRLPENAGGQSQAADTKQAAVQSAESSSKGLQTYEQVIQLDPTQLLATLKLTQLSGVLTLIYDLLVQSFNSLAVSEPANASMKQPTDLANVCGTVGQLRLALASLRLINYVAYIDVRLVQATLAADEMLPLQLRHVCSYLISFLVQSQFKPMEPKWLLSSTATNGAQQIVDLVAIEQEAAPAKQGANDSMLAGDQLKSELMGEIILLLGYFAYLNLDNQLMLKSGRQPSIIEQLVNLPFEYFSREPLKLVLMPTLISCAYLNEQICALVCQELSLSMLTSFIEDQLLGAQVERQQRGETNLTLVTDELTNRKLISSRWHFEHRFAKSKWLSAKKFFERQQASARLLSS